MEAKDGDASGGPDDAIWNGDGQSIPIEIQCFKNKAMPIDFRKTSALITKVKDVAELMHVSSRIQ